MSQVTYESRQQQLQEELWALGSLVEELLIESVDLLRQNELGTLERLGEDTWQIRRKRLSIEMSCLSLIATRRPRDERLRTLVATVEIAAELEQVAEHARRVARVNYLVADQQLSRPLASIQRLARMVQSSLDHVLEAFKQKDLGLAQKVLADSQRVNELYEQAHQELLTVMQSKPRIANQAIYLSRAAYNLKRAAERVAGMHEWVLFCQTGTMGQAASVHPQLDIAAKHAHEEELVC